MSEITVNSNSNQEDGRFKSQNFNDITAEEVSLKKIIRRGQEWWNYLLSKWILIVALILFGSGINLVRSFFQKPIYTATLSFALEDDKSDGGLGGAAGIASQFGFNLGSGGGGAFSGDNLMELMKSRSMTQATLLKDIDINGKKEKLVNLYISFNHLRDKWANKPKLKNVSFNDDNTATKLTRDSLLGAFVKDILKNNLSVEKNDRKLSIITVTVKSTNELFSKYFSETLTKTVSDFYIDTKTKKSVKNLSILQVQTDSVKRILNSSITSVATFLDVNPNLNASRQVLRAPSQRRQVDVQSNTVLLNQLVANLEIAKISLRKETPLIQIIDTPILPLDVEKASKLNAVIMGGFIAGVFVIVALTLKMIYDGIKLS